MKAGKKDRVFEIVTTVLLVMILIVALYPLYFSLIAHQQPESGLSGKGFVSAGGCHPGWLPEDICR